MKRFLACLLLLALTAAFAACGVCEGSILNVGGALSSTLTGGAVEESLESTDLAGLYETARAFLEQGNLAEAQAAFYSLGNYEDSRDCYFYISALLLEKQGRHEAAAAVYELLKGFVPEGMTQVLEDVELTSFNEFSGLTPYYVDDYSGTEGYYAVYYNIETADAIQNYAEQFAKAGWQIQTDTGDGWPMIYFVTPGGGYNDIFYVMYNVDQGLAIFVYDPTVEYGFDPLSGLE